LQMLYILYIYNWKNTVKLTAIKAKNAHIHIIFLCKNIILFMVAEMFQWWIECFIFTPDLSEIISLPELSTYIRTLILPRIHGKKLNIE
jgi:hypothetical protein